MIAVDTSAIVAILRTEPEEHRIRACLSRAQSRISASSLLELQIVLGGRLPMAWREAERILTDYSIAVHPFDERQLHVAREAVLKFGKGRHKAALNYGDCFAYALAKSENLPLLCTGNDFAHTDLQLA